MIRGHENLKFITQLEATQIAVVREEEASSADAKNLILHTRTHTRT